MTPVREQRQRAAARARLEREMSERLELAQKRRKRNAFVGGGVGILLVLGLSIWGITALTGSSKPSANPSAAAPVGCQWLPDDASANPNLKEVGTPPANEPRAGKQTMTMTTNLGVIEAELDVTKAPCASASLSYLASKKYYDNSKCHRMVDTGFKILQCGGVGASPGASGPTYKFAEENLPKNLNPSYQRGQIAMAKAQSPATTGAQFFLIDQDIPDSSLPADYTIVGKITKGMDILDAVVKAGTFITNDKGETLKEEAQDGSTWTAPKKAVEIKTFVVSAVTA
jgi:peptidyl-prolyl cis-trans isomerase B (cyclophilin B)